MNIKEAKVLVNYARKSIELGLKDKDYKPKSVPETLKVKRGVFVTLEKFPNKALRGCIGVIEAVKPLYKAVINAAKAAAFSDPRFKSLREDELNRLTIEVSILSIPKLLDGNPRNFPEQIVIGRDGLIIEFGMFKGLLLPQVATEWGVNAVEFLEMTCQKAGMPPGSWTDQRVKVYTFSAELWKEETPGGKVKKHEIN
jgi:uncharacterized protein (TIGR00296 family)